MVTSLFRSRRIETTDVRAKELRKLAEKLITTAKRGDLQARRTVMRTITDAKVVRELFETIAPTYVNRNGGYTRILKSNRRKGDNAPLSFIELVDLEPKIEELEDRVEMKKKKKEERKRADEEAAARAGAAAPTESTPAEK
jgi:large subunit ribosomal protein L17